MVPASAQTRATWTLTPCPGVLTFTQNSGLNVGPLPNFEAPQDDSTDGSSNTYTITVRATDNHGKETDYAVTITVTDVNEAPEFVGTPMVSVTYNENALIDVADYDARDEEGGVTWSLTGTDSGDFAIDSGGVVTFAATPDYEMPTGSQSDGHGHRRQRLHVYGGRYRRRERLDLAANVSVDVTVTVADVEEAGAISVDTLNPGVGDTVTFMLTDPDGGIVG